MMKKILPAILAISCATLTGCGPTFETQYTFEAPNTPVGKMCVIQCTSDKSHCKNRAHREYERCKSRYSKITDQMFHCKDTSEQCDADFRECVTVCGGKVHAKTVQTS